MRNNHLFTLYDTMGHLTKTNHPKRKKNSILNFVLSVGLGFLISIVIQLLILSRTPCQILNSFSNKFYQKLPQSLGSPQPLKDFGPNNNNLNSVLANENHLPNNVPEIGSNVNNLVIVGVMTAQKFINSRVIAGYETWAKTIPGKVIYFCSDIDVDSDNMTLNANSTQLPLNGTETEMDLDSDKIFEMSPKFLRFKPKRIHIPGMSPEQEPLIISLPGVTDAYPPQKKSFMMLKFLYDNFYDQFKWFIRADDDVFIRGDQLTTLLKSLNENRPYFIGQTGQGIKAEMGLLHLNFDENFCMGGPSMILSKETIKRMAPHIKYCLNHLYTSHEDIEIGRCVKTFAGTACTWAYETQNIFLHNPNGETVWIRNNTSTMKAAYDRALTIHPFKNHMGFYDARAYFLQRKMMHLRQYHWQLKLQLNAFKKTASNDPFVKPKFDRKQNIPQYVYVVKDYILLSNKMSNPKRKIDDSLKEHLENIKNWIVAHLNPLIQNQGLYFYKSEIRWTYLSVDNPLGHDMYMSILFNYKRHKSNYRKWIDAEFKIHCPYYDMIFQEFDPLDTRLTMRSGLNITNSKNVGNENKKASQPAGPILDLNAWKPVFASLVDRIKEMALSDSSNKQDILDSNSNSKNDFMNEWRKITINFIVPLAGRMANFKRFLTNFELVCLANNEAVTLTIVNFQINDINNISIPTMENNETNTLILQYLNELKTKYPIYTNAIDIINLKGDFSRGLALEIGSSRFQANDLLFFIDVDMIFDRAFLRRVRHFARFNQSIYYPIVFSQYNPEFVPGNKNYIQSINDFNITLLPNLLSFANQGHLISLERGYWRTYGFGLVGIYKYDFEQVGGFDMSILGWGKEDVDLFDKSLKEKYQVYHAPDPGLIHVFHDSECPSELKDDQFAMCLKSKGNNLANNKNLYNYLYNPNSEKKIT